MSDRTVPRVTAEATRIELYIKTDGCIVYILPDQRVAIVGPNQELVIISASDYILRQNPLYWVNRLSPATAGDGS